MNFKELTDQIQQLEAKLEAAEIRVRDAEQWAVTCEKNLADAQSDIAHEVADRQRWETRARALEAVLSELVEASEDYRIHSEVLLLDDTARALTLMMVRDSARKLLTMKAERSGT